MGPGREWAHFPLLRFFFYEVFRGYFLNYITEAVDNLCFNNPTVLVQHIKAAHRLKPGVLVLAFSAQGLSLPTRVTSLGVCPNPARW